MRRACSFIPAIFHQSAPFRPPDAPPKKESRKLRPSRMHTALLLLHFFFFPKFNPLDLKPVCPVVQLDIVVAAEYISQVSDFLDTCALTSVERYRHFQSIVKVDGHRKLRQSVQLRPRCDLDFI